MVHKIRIHQDRDILLLVNVKYVEIIYSYQKCLHNNSIQKYVDNKSVNVFKHVLQVYERERGKTYRMTEVRRPMPKAGSSFTGCAKGGSKFEPMSSIFIGFPSNRTSLYCFNAVSASWRLEYTTSAVPCASAC